MKTMTNQSGVTDLPPERSARVVEEFEQPRYSRRDTLLTMFGVLMVMLLGSLDQTIVATALPHVIADLHGFDRYTWVSTAYLLASTVTVPIYGKLSDLFGRKPTPEGERRGRRRQEPTRSPRAGLGILFQLIRGPISDSPGRRPVRFFDSSR